MNNLHNRLSRSQNCKKFEVTTAKKINRSKIFLYFSVAKHLIRKNPAEFSMVGSELKQYQLRKKEYF